MKIERFDGEYRFLSNFYPSPMLIKGIHYKTAEHYYQSMKTLDFHERNAIITAPTAGKAKRLGSRCSLRPDWYLIRDEVMETAISEKFNQNFSLLLKLIQTNDFEIEEGNDWNDTYWGIDLKTNQGENRLGKLLMLIRKEYKESISK